MKNLMDEANRYLRKEPYHVLTKLSFSRSELVLAEGYADIAFQTFLKVITVTVRCDLLYGIRQHGCVVR
jgi:hypothetical protein